jgi:hypothetical protein
MPPLSTLFLSLYEPLVRLDTLRSGHCSLLPYICSGVRDPADGKCGGGGRPGGEPAPAKLPSGPRHTGRPGPAPPPGPLAARPAHSGAPQVTLCAQPGSKTGR